MNMINKDSSEAVSITEEKRIKTSKGFADASRIVLEKNSLFEKSEKVGLSYIMSINVDRLLAPSFEMHNMVPPNNAVRYGGWERKSANNWCNSKESYTLAGHSLGHWMSAAAVFYKATGECEVIKSLNYVIEELDRLQKESGSAYIGGCSEDCFISLFDGNVSSWSDNYWVPWYGVHKIYQGLLDAYDYTGNETAFKVLKKFSDWAVEGSSKLSYEQMQMMLNVEYGGMNEIFARLYEITRDEKYLYTARRFTHDNILNPLIAGNDLLTGLHANTQIPKIVGAAEIYEQNPTKYADYKLACKNFWDYVNNDRSYAIGGNSISEHFEAMGAESLGVKTCESCNTYNMMRLTEHLFSWEHDSRYFDWYEKALYNHILGQQEPETGAKMYFVSLLPGHHKVYEKKEQSWWCCTGTGMENPGRYRRCAYYEDGNSLYVNLYMAGTYSWDEKKVKLKIETNYPYSDKIRIEVSGSGKFSIKLRAPKWLKATMTAVINGDIYKSNGGEYLDVNRSFKDGDVIDITIPMNIEVYKSRQMHQIAFMYGPIVLAAELGSISGVSGVNEYISNETLIDSVTSDVPDLKSNGEPIESIINAVDVSKLAFIIKGRNTSTGEDIKLKPFYEIHHKFQNAYWNIDSTADEFETKLNKITIDRVEPDGQQDEIGHGLIAKNSNNGNLTIGTKMYYWRDAYGSDDSYFEYNLKCDEIKKNYIFIRYYGSDGDFMNYTRSFNIIINGHKVAKQTIKMPNPGGVYDIFYDIPLEYTKGKSCIKLRFTPIDASSCAGGMLEARVTSADISKE